MLTLIWDDVYASFGFLDFGDCLLGVEYVYTLGPAFSFCTQHWNLVRKKLLLNHIEGEWYVLSLIVQCHVLRSRCRTSLLLVVSGNDHFSVCSQQETEAFLMFTVLTQHV